MIETVLRAGLRLDEKIAAGTFGVVYRGRQLAVARDVAIKILHPGFSPEAEPGLLFRDEIRAIGTIDHPNVVKVFDADDTSDGRLYFVMELLEGPTLQQLADAGPVPPARAVALIAQLLDGLAAVHAAGHIHADVKPSNAVVVGTGVRERVVLIDFGLSRLRRVGQAAEAVGGTRTYMAPEQLRAWIVDPRSDVFSAALVLVKLITGWHRSSDDELVPPLDAITEPALRVALERALALEPDARPSAADFMRALRGGPPDEEPPPGPPPPFRELAPLTERDRGRFHGRDDDIIRLARRIDPTRPLVLTAPSGTGKTSLLRAGLVPYLDATGVASLYLACEPGAGEELARRLAVWNTKHQARRRVVIIDQLESVLASAEAEALLSAALERGRCDAAAVVLGIREDTASDERDTAAVVLGIREDFVARLLAATTQLAEGVPQARLGPLTRAGARAALLGPLSEHGVAIEPVLLETLLDDLVLAGSEVGAALGWSAREAIYPPHLQLAGSALIDALGGRVSLTLAHYRALGGLHAIVGEHLERSLGELSASDRAIARELFLSLVASAHTRAVRDETELVEMIRVRHSESAVRDVLERLAVRRLVTRQVRDGTVSWSLVHDMLVPRIEAWFSVHDLDRRRATELIRFQLRHSRRDAPATLTARQLALIARFPGVVEELEAEWALRPDAVWTPRQLVERSRRLVVYRRTVLAAAIIAVAAITTVLLSGWLEERTQRLHEAYLREFNLGQFELSLSVFEWVEDPRGALREVDVDLTALPALDWWLYDPHPNDPEDVGLPVVPGRLSRGTARPVRGGAGLVFNVEARGGAAFLRVTGRGRNGETCPPSTIPLRRLPGVGDDRRELHVRVPTCAATSLGMVRIPAGQFFAHGLGDPPTRQDDGMPPGQVVRLPAYWIDRTEVTIAAFATFARMSEVHDITAPGCARHFGDSCGPQYARGDLDWSEARAYCRFLGKELPSSLEWQRALRGGLTIGGQLNPHPRRNLPWGLPPFDAWGLFAFRPPPAALAWSTVNSPNDPRHPSRVGAHPRDTSPDGVMDLAGNLQEWTNDVEPGHERVHISRRPRITRGGNWFDTDAPNLIHYTAIQNPRSPRARFPYLGMRCAMPASD